MLINPYSRFMKNPFRSKPSRENLIDALMLAALELRNPEPNTDRRTAVIQIAIWAEKTR